MYQICRETVIGETKLVINWSKMVKNHPNCSKLVKNDWISVKMVEIWRKTYQICRKTAIGESKLVVDRSKMVKNHPNCSKSVKNCWNLTKNDPNFQNPLLPLQKNWIQFPNIKRPWKFHQKFNGKWPKLVKDLAENGTEEIFTHNSTRNRGKDNKKKEKKNKKRKTIAKN